MSAKFFILMGCFFAILILLSGTFAQPSNPNMAPTYQDLGAGTPRPTPIKPDGPLNSCRIKCGNLKCGEDGCKTCRPAFCNRQACISGCAERLRR